MNWQRGVNLKPRSPTKEAYDGIGRLFIRWVDFTSVWMLEKNMAENFESLA